MPKALNIASLSSTRSDVNFDGTASFGGSTEVYRTPSDVHSSLAKFEAGLEASSDEIAPSLLIS